MLNTRLSFSKNINLIVISSAQSDCILMLLSVFGGAPLIRIDITYPAASTYIAARRLLQVILAQFLAHHHFLIAAHASDRNLLHFIVKLNAQHSFFFLLFHRLIL